MIVPKKSENVAKEEAKEEKENEQELIAQNLNKRKASLVNMEKGKRLFVVLQVYSVDKFVQNGRGH